MILRAAIDGDAGRLNDIYNHYVLHSDCTMQTKPSTVEERRAWLASAVEALVVEDGGEIVGWGALVPYSPREGYRWTVEDSVYVRADALGRGIGTRLLAELVARAQTRGLHSIVAKIAASETASVALHSRFGFVTAGVLKEAGFKRGKWLDVLFMQRLL